MFIVSRSLLLTKGFGTEERGIAVSNFSPYNIVAMLCKRYVSVLRLP